MTSGYLGLRVIAYEPVSKCPPDFMAIRSKSKTFISLRRVSNLEELGGHPFSLSFFIFQVHVQIWGRGCEQGIKSSTELLGR